MFDESIFNAYCVNYCIHNKEDERKRLSSLYGVDDFTQMLELDFDCKIQSKFEDEVMEFVAPLYVYAVRSAVSHVSFDSVCKELDEGDGTTYSDMAWRACTLDLASVASKSGKNIIQIIAQWLDMGSHDRTPQMGNIEEVFLSYMKSVTVPEHSGLFKVNLTDVYEYDVVIGDVLTKCLDLFRLCWDLEKLTARAKLSIWLVLVYQLLNQVHNLFFVVTPYEVTILANYVQGHRYAEMKDFMESRLVPWSIFESYADHKGLSRMVLSVMRLFPFRIHNEYRDWVMWTDRVGDTRYVYLKTRESTYSISVYRGNTYADFGSMASRRMFALAYISMFHTQMQTLDIPVLMWDTARGVLKDGDIVQLQDATCYCKYMHSYIVAKYPIGDIALELMATVDTKGYMHIIKYENGSFMCNSKEGIDVLKKLCEKGGLS